MYNVMQLTIFSLTKANHKHPGIISSTSVQRILGLVLGLWSSLKCSLALIVYSHLQVEIYSVSTNTKHTFLHYSCLKPKAIVSWLFPFLTPVSQSRLLHSAGPHFCGFGFMKSFHYLSLFILGETSVISHRIFQCVLAVIEVAHTGTSTIPVFTPRQVTVSFIQYSSIRLPFIVTSNPA